MTNLLRVFTILLCILCTLGCNSPDDTENVNQNQARSVPLLNAIYKYKVDQGLFPTDVDVLLNDYILQLPRTVNGNEYQYKLSPRKDANHFVLTFDMKNDAYCSFRSDLDDWECGFGLDH